MKKVFTFIISTSFFASVFSQQTVMISRTEIEARSLDENLQIRMVKNRANLAQTELLGTGAMYLPNVTASYTFTNTNNPLMAFGSRLNQERITMMDFNPDNLNSPKSISNFGKDRKY